MWVVLAVLALACTALWIRLAPSDPAVWHIDPVTDTVPDCIPYAVPGGARAACEVADSAADALARLDAVAVAFPHTLRIAGSPAQGRITWVTRSLLWGFPDYTTAAVVPAPQGSRIDLFARQRFGQHDWGVNAARLQSWLANL